MPGHCRVITIIISAGFYAPVKLAAFLLFANRLQNKNPRKDASWPASKEPSAVVMLNQGCLPLPEEQQALALPPNGLGSWGYLVSPPSFFLPGKLSWEEGEGTTSWEITIKNPPLRSLTIHEFPDIRALSPGRVARNIGSAQNFSVFLFRNAFIWSWWPFACYHIMKVNILVTLF